MVMDSMSNTSGCRNEYIRLRELMENLYRRFNRRMYVHPDPVEVLYQYDSPAAREVVALVAASLAYGRVGQILKNIRWVLQRIEPDPAAFLRDNSTRNIAARLRGFRHRFAGEGHMAALLCGTKGVIEDYGSLGECFRSGMDSDSPTVLPALRNFTQRLRHGTKGDCGHLLAEPTAGSACKRLNLFLRWMVRHDAVDPGGWRGIPRSGLIVPLDTHLHRISLLLGLTRRKSANMNAALEITAVFRDINPDDPVKYDFALTRLGIHPEMKIEDLLIECNRAGVKYARNTD